MVDFSNFVFNWNWKYLGCVFKGEKTKMTKLANMDLGMRGKPMVYCEKCKHWVPQIDKHNKKRHKNEEKKLR